MTLRKRQTVEIERGSTRSYFVENWHWKSQWICRKEDCAMIQLHKPILSRCGLKWIRHLMVKPDCISPTPFYLAAKPVTSYTPPRFPVALLQPSYCSHCMLLPVAIFALPSLPSDRYCRPTWAIRICLASAHLICTNTLTTQLPLPLKIDSPASVPTTAYWEHFLITGSVTNHVVSPNFLSEVRTFSYYLWHCTYDIIQTGSY